jgi:dihydrofolate synthase / folylpolyglutamate synthase
VGGQDDGADVAPGEACRSTRPVRPAGSICRLGPHPGPPPLTQSPATSTIEPSSGAEVRPRTNSGESGNCCDPSAIRDALRAVHVAGTAGKGSVTAFVASILTVHGFKVGAYLSPHAYSVLERFQLDGQPVAAEVAARQLADIAPMVATMDAYSGDQPSFFEVTTALAFQIFAAASVDYAVIETGLGGLLDATNTISRSDKIAVITTIGLDHTDVLGPTLQEIAMQKAGILPRGWPSIGGPRRRGQSCRCHRRGGPAAAIVDVSAYLRAAAVGPDGTVLRPARRS